MLPSRLDRSCPYGLLLDVPVYPREIRLLIQKLEHISKCEGRVLRVQLSKDPLYELEVGFRIHSQPQMSGRLTQISLDVPAPVFVRVLPEMKRDMLVISGIRRHAIDLGEIWQPEDADIGTARRRVRKNVAHEIGAAHQEVADNLVHEPR